MDTTLYLTVSTGTLASFTVEVIKWLYRKFIAKDIAYDFPPIFYELGLPFVTALWGVALYYLGVGGGVLLEWKTLLEWFISIMISLATYYLVNKPFKTYAREYKLEKGG